MYKRMYLALFNAIIKALDENNINLIKRILKETQLDAESICIDSDEKI